jgi:hypothetical protein
MGFRFSRRRIRLATLFVQPVHAQSQAVLVAVLS